MAPARRKKISTSPPPQLKPVLPADTPPSSPTRLSSTTPIPTTPVRLRSPIQKGHLSGLTSPQRRILVDNLMLEMNERVRRLRAQYEVQAQALRHRIEMRINRVPKKLWNAKMGELLLKHATSGTSHIVAPIQPVVSVDAQVFVEEVKRLSDNHELSHGPTEDTSEQDSKRLVVSKKRVAKKAASSKVTSSNTCRSDLPLTHNNSSAAEFNRSPPEAGTSHDASHPPSSPMRRVFSPSPKKKSPLLPTSPLNTDTAVNTPVPEAQALSMKSSNVKPIAKTSRGNSIKSRDLQLTTQENERHYIKSTLSSGSLKENKVEGVKKDKLDTVMDAKGGSSDKSATGGRRVLRQRK